MTYNQEIEDWLEAQHKIALRTAEKSNQPEQALYYARAKAFEDIIRHIGKVIPR